VAIDYGEQIIQVVEHAGGQKALGLILRMIFGIEYYRHCESMEPHSEMKTAPYSGRRRVFLS
jgi:hypothetical protein